MTMPEPCKVAFVGAGYMAREHLRAFADVPNVELTGLFSRTAERAHAIAEAYPGLSLCASVEELYDRTQSDLVVIAVNELSVAEIARAAFEFPWTVLVEKPAGYDLVEAERIAALARDKGQDVRVALNRRCYASTRSVRNRLDRIEGARFIKVQDQQDLIEARRLCKPEAVIANWMYANAIHLVDYFHALGRGVVTDVTPVVPWSAENPDIVVAKLSFASGDIGLYEAVWNRPGPWAISVNAGGERYEMRPLEQAAMQCYGERRLSPLPPNLWDEQFKPGLRYQAEQAVRAARGQPSDLPDIAQALESMRLVARIYGIKRARPVAV
jgi:predicted dehydrogenase